MKKHMHEFGAFALALAMSGLPAIAFAEEGSSRGDDSSAQVRVELRAEDSLGTDSRSDSAEGRVEVRLRGADGDDDMWEFELEDADEDSAVSFDDLKLKIESRKHELDDEEASSTSRTRDIVKNANPVRLAVHSLLASKDLLGGIGAQISVIAREMNDSVASTTNAEAQAQSRGFLAHLFFGGDRVAADVIAKEVAANEVRIADLKKLLGEANVPADIQATLSAQITALETAQVRLAALAQREEKLWGLFSWRF